MIQQAEKKIFSTAELDESMPAWAWAGDAVEAFVADLVRKDVPFPCPFGVQNYKQSTLRFAFIESGEDMADALVEYLGMCEELAPSTSLVAIFREPATGTIEDYTAWFWAALQDLHDKDPEPWPEGLPTDLQDPRWAYAFGGESYFVVCNTPAHKLRVSRRSLLPIITFTPRWSFKGIEGDTPAGIAVRDSIREKVRAYDEVAPYPHFSAYGEGLDWVQYFLPDTNPHADVSATTKPPLTITRKP